MFQNYKNSRITSQDIITQTELTYQNQNKSKQALAKKLLELGNLFLEKKQFGTAIDLFTLSDYFGNQSALLLKARILVKQGEHFKAFCCLRMLIARSYEKTEFTEYLREFDTRQKLLILSACIDAYLPLNVDYSDTDHSFAEIEHFLLLFYLSLNKLQNDSSLTKEEELQFKGIYFSRQATVALFKKDVKSAMDLFEKALAFVPENLYTLCRLWSYCEKNGFTKGAESYKKRIQKATNHHFPSLPPTQPFVSLASQNKREASQNILKFDELLCQSDIKNNETYTNLIKNAQTLYYEQISSLNTLSHLLINMAFEKNAEALDLLSLSELLGNKMSWFHIANMYYEENNYLKALFYYKRLIFSMAECNLVHYQTHTVKYIDTLSPQMKICILTRFVNSSLLEQKVTLETFEHALNRLSGVILSKEYQNDLNNNSQLPSINAIHYFILSSRAELYRRQHKLKEALALSTQARQYYNANGFYALSRPQQVLKKEENKGNTSYYTVQLF